MRPSPLNPNDLSDWAYETPNLQSTMTGRRALPRSGGVGSTAARGTQEHFHNDHANTIPGIPTSSGCSFAASTTSRTNTSRPSQVDPHAKLASFYMVSGLSKVGRSKSIH